MTARRRALAALCTTLVLAGWPGTAFADAAGPTDFRTVVTAITPATATIAVSIEGGDSFVRLVVDRGASVTVLGYDDEPYLRIDADGTVSENRRSYAAYYNSSRFGTTSIPDSVDNTAEPEWVEVGDGGTWAWHDHRAHWMGVEAPVGMQPGDALPAEVIPLVVDGIRVEVEVVSTLVGGPSPVPPVAGAIAGALVTAMALVRRTRPLAAEVTLLWSAVALAVGVVQFRSLPAETGPSLTWWLPAAIAVACAALAVAWRRGSVVSRLGAVLLAGAQLLLWTSVRRLTFVRPVLPTDAPFWLDRMASAAVAAGALTVLGWCVAVLWQLVRQPARASSIAVFRAS